MRLRAEALGLAVDASFLRFVFLHRKYNPAQPRIPAGNPGGGRWTDGGWVFDDGLVRVAQNGPVRPTVRRSRLSGREVEGTEGQISEWAATRLQADAAVMAVRRIDRNWRPKYPTSLTETIEGEISAERYRLEAAEARLRELGDPDLRGEVLHQCMTTGPTSIGWRSRTTSDVSIRTVDRETFLDVGARLLVGAERTVYSTGYRFPQFLRRDGTVIGIRYSADSDVSIDVIRGDGAQIMNGFKIHFSGG